MFRNYIITAFRNLKRNKTYTIINVFGLALGISAALVLFKVVLFEKSFDKHHSNYEDIYRFTREEINSNVTEIESGMPNPFTEAFKNDFPEFGLPVRTYYHGEGQISLEGAGGNWQHFEIERGVGFVDSEVFQVFDFNLLIGDPKTVLAEPKTTVISESLAERLFGVDRNSIDQVIGREVKIDNSLSVRITGVYEDFPQNSIFPFVIMTEYESLEGFFDFFAPNAWGSTSSNANVYLLKAEGVTKEQIEAQMHAFEEKYLDEDDAANTNYLLQPFSEIHFDTSIDVYGDRHIDRQKILIPTVVAIFLILTACVNFVNLATAQAVKRSKEVGIRKVLGGQKRQLALQFIGETFFLTLISVLISLGAAELVLTNLPELIGYELSLDLLNDLPLLGLVVSITVLVTLLAGIYPSLILSSLKPVTALKSKGQSAMAGKMILRRVLVIFQFWISQVLIIGTFVVISQMDYFENKELGFRKTSIITFPIPENDPDKLQLMKTQLNQNARISKVSYSFSSPSSSSTVGSSFNYAPLQSEKSFDASFKIIDPDFMDLFEIELLAGRNLRSSDTTWTNVIVSETVIKIMNIDDPEEAIGLNIETGINGEKTIVGVVSDFHSNSLRSKIPPLILLNYPAFYYQAAVRFEGNEEEHQDILANIEQAWGEHFPDYIFDYSLYSEKLLEYYDDEAGQLNLYKIFSGIAILIGCLGLYGLIAFMANQKTKEIGVRKVLGASISQILNIFSKELLFLILIAFLLAAPVGYFLMDSWLQDFVYRIDIEMRVFVVAIGFTIVIGGLTTGFRSIKAAKANPVDSLRAE